MHDMSNTTPHDSSVGGRMGQKGARDEAEKRRVAEELRKRGVQSNVSEEQVDLSLPKQKARLIADR